MMKELKTTKKLDYLDKTCLVIDDFAPVTLQNDLENIFRDGDIDWKYTDWTVEPKDWNNNPNILETPQLVHISKQEDGVYDREHFYLQCSLVYLLQELLSCQINGIDRIKNNCLLQHPGFENKFHPPHQDSTFPNRFTLIYYVSDSDGPTRLFKKKIPHLGFGEDNLKILKEVEPKKGRAMLFPSKLWHSGSCPTKHRSRFVNNIVFESRDLEL